METESGDDSRDKRDTRIAIPESTRKQIEACLCNAEDLLISARKVQEASKHNVAYHLAVLALEEVGKAVLLGMMFMSKIRGDPQPWQEKHSGYHVKKLFWALWSPSFGRERITRDQIETMQGLAQRIHERRMRGLYVSIDENDSMLPKDAVAPDDAANMIQLTEARLGSEKCKSLTDVPQQLLENTSWLMNAMEDAELRRFIWSRTSMDKLVELGRVQLWVEWLQEQDAKAKADAQAAIEKELGRQKPSPSEEDEPKWQIRVRFVTNTHVIRPKTLTDWNKQFGHVMMLSPVDKKKDQLFADFTAGKRVHISYVWTCGWNAARRFAAALNIGTLGLFWWYVPQQVSRYYEKLTDLESKRELLIERKPQLKFDMKPQVLNERDLRNVALCFGFLPHANEREKHDPFDHYLTGIGFLSKNDIHIQFELNAFAQFYDALKSGMRVYGDWDGTSAFRSVVDGFLAEIMPEKDRKEFLDICERFETRPPDAPRITLEEVGIMKCCCDAYFIRTFQELAKKMSSQ